MAHRASKGRACRRSGLIFSSGRDLLRVPLNAQIWGEGRTPAGYYGARFYDGKLGACERRFRKQFARASELLDGSPLCAQDKYVLAVRAGPAGPCNVCVLPSEGRPGPVIHAVGLSEEALRMLARLLVGTPGR